MSFEPIVFFPLKKYIQETQGDLDYLEGQQCCTEPFRGYELLVRCVLTELMNTAKSETKKKWTITSPS